MTSTATTQACLWCGHACAPSDFWCPECGHAAHTPKVYCTCGRAGCCKRTPADDYADAMAQRTVPPPMTDEQLAEAKRRLDAIYEQQPAARKRRPRTAKTEKQSNDEQRSTTEAADAEA